MKCEIRAVKRAIVIERGWGKGTGVFDTICIGLPAAGEGLLHIIPSDFDNTNNISFVNCGLAFPSPDAEGYLIKWDDYHGWESYFIDVNTRDHNKVERGVYINAWGHLKFIRCSLLCVDDDQGGPNMYIGCRIRGSSSISGEGSYKAQAIIDSCEFRCDPETGDGTFKISHAMISNSRFCGQTIIKENCIVNNSHFMPGKDPQKFIIRVYNSDPSKCTRLSNILISDLYPKWGKHIPCLRALEIGTPDNDWTSAILVEGLSIVCRKTKIGIKRFLGGSDDYPVIIRNAFIRLNIDGDYDRDECYAIRNDGVLLVLENVIAPDSDKYIFTNSFNKLKIKNVVYGPYTNAKRSENSGVVYVTGDGSTQTFTTDIQHNLITDKATVRITLDREGTVDKICLVDKDGDGFKETIRVQVTFATAPADGEQVPIYWYAEVV